MFALRVAWIFVLVLLSLMSVPVSAGEGGHEAVAGSDGGLTAAAGDEPPGVPGSMSSVGPAGDTAARVERDLSRRFEQIRLAQPYKPLGQHNPIMAHRFGADPYAIVYGDRVYVYSTNDVFARDAAGNIVENHYVPGWRGDRFEEVTVEVEGPGGVHDLFFVFAGDGFYFDAWEFEPR